MSDEKTEAVDKLAEIIKMVIRGWPIYGVVAAMFWGYGELWLDKKISEAISTQTLEQPAIVGLTGAVQGNTNAINGAVNEIGRVSEQVEIVEEDTKEILRMMAGE
jgi:hypothetical protein